MDTEVCISKSLLDSFHAILNADLSKISESYQIETECLKTLILWRNGSENLSSDSDKYLSNGLFFNRPTNAHELQKRYASMYRDIIMLNNNGIPEDVITRYDNEILGVIKHEFNAPMWHQLNEEDLHSSLLPEFRLQRKDDYADNILSSVSNDQPKTDAKLEWYSDLNKDRKIKLHDDLSLDGHVLVNLSTYLQNRITNEMDPHYVYHPIQALFLTLLLLKTVTTASEDGSFYSYGVRYIELLLHHISDENPMLLAYPVTFGTDGTMVGARLYSHYSIKLRMVLNNMTYLLTYKDIHNFKNKYMDVNNEILLYMLKHPNGGRDLKKAVTRINLYYGLKYNPKRTDVLEPIDGVNYSHDHPIHKNVDFTQPVLNATNSFSKAEHCYGHDMKRMNRAIYTNTVKGYINEELIKLDEMSLPKMKEFVSTLIDMRLNHTIIYDVIFMRTLLNIGGYSRSNQITDFKATIDDITEMNERFLSNKDPVNSIDNLLSWMGPKMYQCGYKLTKGILRGEYPYASYPSANDAKAHIDTYVTSKSAGIGNVKLFIDTGRQVYKVRSTSKSTFVNALGMKIYDVNAVSQKPLMLRDFLNNLAEDQYDRFVEEYKKGDISTTEVMRLCGQNTIGSRSTTAWRPVRPIYINVLQAHLAQSFIIGPHIDATTRAMKKPPTGLWFTGDSLGIGFATLYQNGTSDIIAPAIEASSTGKAISVLADCSSWDQTFLTETIKPYYNGIKDALAEHGSASKMNYYMMDTSRHDVHGLTIIETIDWFNVFQNERIFNASYLGERYSFLVKYMWSGRLDTFHMNSTQNSLITEGIAADVQKLVNASLSWYQVAGDDAIMIFDASSISTNAQVERIRSITVDKYTEANHIINPQKTVISHISGEYAKIYYYMGMHFRDPSIQLHESEKTSNAANSVEALRGFAQVCYEYNKRAIGSLRLNTLYSRLLAGMAYAITVKKKGEDKDTSQNLKFYPPPSAVIIPAAYKGGLGASYTGISLNEVLFIRLHLADIVEKGIYVTNMVQFSANDVVANSLTKHFLKDKPNLIKDFKLGDNTDRISSIKYKSSDSAFSGGDFINGLNLKLNSLDISRINASRSAVARLKTNGINIPNSFTYENLPYSTMHNSFKNLVIEKDIARLTNEKLILELANFKGDVPKVSITSKYPIYNLFDVNVKEYVGVTNDSPIRYISTPIEGKILERLLGSRCGIQFKNRGYGGSQEILFFIRRNGLAITEEQLIELITSSGALVSGNVRNTLIGIFEAVSGDPASSLSLANFFMEEKPHWEDNAVSVTITGSLLENCDSRYQNISQYCKVPAVYMKDDIKKMLTYIGYVYFTQRVILNSSTVDIVHINIRDEEMKRFLMQSKPVKSRMRKSDGQSNLTNINTGGMLNSTVELMEDPYATGFHARFVEPQEEIREEYDSLLINHPLSIPFTSNQIERFAVTQSEQLQ